MCYNLSDQVMCDACCVYCMDEFYVVCAAGQCPKNRSQSLSWMLGREKIIIVCSVKRNAVRDFNSRFHGNNPRIFTNERKPTLQWAPSKIKESFLVNCNHIFIFSFFFFQFLQDQKNVRVGKSKIV